MNSPAVVAQQQNQSSQQLQLAQFFNQLFIELQAIFPAWRQALPSVEHINAAKRNWMAAMIDAGINTQEQIEQGLSKARLKASPFFPAPGEFIAWCKPEAVNQFPDPEQAFAEAIRNAGKIGTRKWTHAAIQEAATRVGLFDLSRMNAAEAQKSFLSAFKKVCDEMGSGTLRIALSHDSGGNIDKSKPSSQAVLPKRPIPNPTPQDFEQVKRLIGGEKTRSQALPNYDRNDPLLRNEAES